MIALIDGDSMIFMLGWVHKEHQNVNEMYQSVDTFLENLFIMTGADQYYGAIAGPHKCFRHNLYKVKSYKGNRPEQTDYMNFWRPIVSRYLIEKWRFDLCTKPPLEAYEADDLIFTAWQNIAFNVDLECIICSPDKDLRTIVGKHYDYRKNEFCQIDSHQATYNLFKLMIEGDDTDNIAGIPGQGPKKVKEKLDPLLEAKAPVSSYEELVKSLYHKHFGEYYGSLIYEETLRTICLVFDKEREIKIHSVPQKIHPLDMA